MLLGIISFLFFHTSNICVNFENNEEYILSYLDKKDLNYSYVDAKETENMIFIDDVRISGVKGTCCISTDKESKNILQISFTPNSSSNFTEKRLYLYLLLKLGKPYTTQETDIFDGIYFQKNNKTGILYINKKDNTISLLLKPHQQN